jgi:O-methyltransferase
MKAVLTSVSPSTNLKLIIFFTKRKLYFADNFATNLYVGFLNEVKFKSAFTSSLRGIRRDDILSSTPGLLSGIEWRAHIVCWAANKVQDLDGDFVDCGVWKGVLPKTICEYIGFESLPKTYFLVDPWGQGLKNNLYTADIYEEVCSRFSKYPNVKLIRGLVPEALSLIESSKIAYLAIDMNGSEPERAALEFFYPRLVSGGVIYLDDYGWNFPELRATVDEFLSDKPESLLHFPNGTAILIKH